MCLIKFSQLSLKGHHSQPSNEFRLTYMRLLSVSPCVTLYQSINLWQPQTSPSMARRRIRKKLPNRAPHTPPMRARLLHYATYTLPHLGRESGRPTTKGHWTESSSKWRQSLETAKKACKCAHWHLKAQLTHESIKESRAQQREPWKMEEDQTLHPRCLLAL